MGVPYPKSDIAANQNSGQIEARSQIPTGSRTLKTTSSNTPTASHLSTMQQRPSTTSPSPINTSIANPTPLPPDVALARKTRMNADLIKLFKRPCPPNTTPSVKGIGLYTHVQGPTRIPQFPHERYMHAGPEFLPIGGPKKVRKSGVEAPLSEEVREVFEEVKTAVLELCVNGNTESSLGGLKRRYGALDVPTYVPQPQREDGTQQIGLQQQDAAMQEDIAGQERAVDGRRRSMGGASAGAVAESGDVAMGGTEPERRGSTGATRTATTYEASRDPRLRGR